MANPTHDTQLLLLFRRVRINPNDTEALEQIYKSALNFQYGWHGFPMNTIQSQKFMHFAAKYGHTQACYDLARKFLSNEPQQSLAYVQRGLERNPEDQQLRGLLGALDALERQKRSDEAQQVEARRIVVNREGLAEAIREKIFPCVVSIMTEGGVIGTGFYQHSEWLVSNAHVIPNTEILSGSTFADFRGTRTSLRAERAFHRPSQKSKSPDIVIIKGNSRDSGNNLSLPMSFTDDDDTGDRIYFYVWFNYEIQKHEVKYLIPRSNGGQFPLIFACEDGSEPRPGCSGAPVVSARLLVGGHDIQWQFETLGIVYARCPNSVGSKLVCAIPVRQEFKQVLDEILFPEDFSRRAEQMALASREVRDNAQRISGYESENSYYKILSEQGISEFESGRTHLDISLPEGLEKLLGKNILDLSSSAFIAKVQKQYKITDARVTNRTQTLEEIAEDFFDFIQTLHKETNIQLRGKQGDSFRMSPKGYFRVDLAGGVNTDHYTLDIQDNIGKGLHAPSPNENQPISSKFAIATVFGKPDNISGKQLVQLLLKSATQNSRLLLKKIQQSKKNQVENSPRDKKALLYYAKCFEHPSWQTPCFPNEEEAEVALQNSEHAVHSYSCAVVTKGDESSSDDDYDINEEPFRSKASQKSKKGTKYR